MAQGKRFWDEESKKRAYKEMVAKGAEKFHADNGEGGDWAEFQKDVDNKFKREFK